MPLCSSEIPRIEISLDNLCYNFGVIRDLTPSHAGIMPVVKDDAYGCGAVYSAKAMEEKGASFFAVARAVEAEKLISSGISSPILVFGECEDNAFKKMYGKSVHFSINSVHSMQRLINSDLELNVHLNIDTGMLRLGISLSEVESVIEKIKKSRLRLKGVYTHYSCSDELESDRVDEQTEVFSRAVDQIIDSGLKLEYVHTPNSAAVITRRRYDICNMVRPGIALYGCMPDPAVDYGVGLKQVVSLKTVVVRLRHVSAGTPVSYGGTYVVQKDTCIATVAAGYAHGVPRLLSNKGSLLIKGRRYKIAGRVTMDYLMVDVGENTDIVEGDEAVLIGCQGDECISADEVALHAGTIGYEILCGFNRDIKHVFFKDGERYDS